MQFHWSAPSEQSRKDFEEIVSFSKDELRSIWRQQKVMIAGYPVLSNKEPATSCQVALTEHPDVECLDSVSPTEPYVHALNNVAALSAAK